VEKEVRALRSLYRILTLALALVLIGATVWAAGHGSGEAAHSGSWSNFFWRVINFVIFVAIVYKLLGKRARDFLTGRRHRIATELKDIETRKADAEKRLAEVEQDITDLDKRREEILSDYRQQGEALKESILSQAQERARQMQVQARSVAEQEIRQATKDLRAEVAESIAQSTEKLISDRLDKEGHKRLVQDYLTRVVLN
jgi:F-type H+-transporting ATPase subunit b